MQQGRYRLVGTLQDIDRVHAGLKFFGRLGGALQPLGRSQFFGPLLHRGAFIRAESVLQSSPCLNSYSACFLEYG